MTVSRARHGTPGRCRVAGCLRAKALVFEAAGWRRQAGICAPGSAYLDLHIGDTHHAHARPDTARPNTTTPHKRKTLASPETLAG